MNPTILDNDLDHSEPKEIIVEPTEEVEKIPEVKQIPVQVVKKKVKISFWTEDPNVLFQPNYVLEFFPVDTMNFNQKLNSLTRLVIIMTFIAFVFT